MRKLNVLVEEGKEVEERSRLGEGMNKIEWLDNLSRRGGSEATGNRNI